jgi:hypothetical protein
MNIIEKIFKDIIDLNSESIDHKDIDEIIELLHTSFKQEYLKIEEDYLSIQKKQNIETVDEYACYWQKGIKKLESFIFICTAFGEVFSKSYVEKNKDEKSLLAKIIIQLHIRACEISETIILLLKSGHIDAAFSQWRILHEVNVIISFIGKHGEECAERYISYMYIDKHKGANQYIDYEKRLNEKGPTDSQLKELKRIYDKLIEKYGKSFGSVNGWACKFIHDDAKCKDKRNISFSDIEKDVELDHLRPYYKRASQYAHVSSVALEADVSFHPVNDDYGVFSKSNIGITTVAHSLVLSLMKITSVLMFIEPSLDSLAIMKTIKDFEKEIGEIFLEIDKKVKL